MKIFGYEIRRERRASAEDPTVPVSSEAFLAFFGVDSTSLPRITVDSALRVPAVAAAVSFLSRTMAALPKHVYRRGKNGSERVTGRLERVIHEAPNESMGAFKFWQYFWQQVFTVGRGLAYIERTPQGIETLWVMDATQTSIRRKDDGTLIYKFGKQSYAERDVIDVSFMLRANQLDHYGPISLASKAIQLALAMNDYGSKFFASGGVPPLSLVGPMPAGPEAVKRAQSDIRRAMEAAKNNGEQIFPIPPGYELKSVGFDPEKGQMTEARRFQIEEIARSWQLPPMFLQDLSRATFTNSEQQDLHLVKHLIGQWAQALEDEMNLKLFGQGNSARYVEHNLDGLLRGDFKSRMEGYATAIQNSIRSPDDCRTLEGLPPRGGNADKLLIQGATVPLDSQPAAAGPVAGDVST